jgi:hypothetical protein
VRKWVIGIIIVAVLGVGSVGYFAYTQTASTTPIAVSKNGVTAQAQNCTKTSGNQFVVTVLLTADPQTVHLWAQANDEIGGYGGNITLRGYGMTTGVQAFSVQAFHDRNGTWTATVPFTVPLIDLPNYDCQLGGWTPILKTY